MKVRKFVKQNKKLISVIIEFVVFLGALTTIFSFFYQRKEWVDNEQSRQYSMLQQIDDKLNSNDDKRITSLLQNKKPVLKNNGGEFSEDDLGNYLNDLSSVSDVYQRKLVDLCSINEWFSGYFTYIKQSPEVNSYIQKIRLKDKEYYLGLDLVGGDLENRIKECK